MPDCNACHLFCSYERDNVKVFWRFHSVSYNFILHITLCYAGSISYNIIATFPCYFVIPLHNLRWPEQSLNAVGGFIILRFFTPALVSPESYGLTDDVPSVEGRRACILISKIIQNISNRTQFHEESMQCINPFVKDNENRMIQFLETIAVRSCARLCSSRYHSFSITNNHCRISSLLHHNNIQSTLAHCNLEYA